MTKTDSERGGLVLCGGKATRMGRDKASLPFGPGETVLSRVVKAVQGAVAAGPVVCVAAEGQSLPVLPAGVIAVRDRYPDRGPLEALATGLGALQGNVEIVFATGCDAPLLQSEVVELLTKELKSNEQAEAVVATVEGRRQPLLAAYRPHVLAKIDALLAAGKRSLMSLLDEAVVKEINENQLRRVDPDLRCVLNCNTHGAYEEALRLAGLDPTRDGQPAATASDSGTSPSRTP